MNETKEKNQIEQEVGRIASDLDELGNTISDLKGKVEFILGPAEIKPEPEVKEEKQKPIASILLGELTGIDRHVLGLIEGVREIIARIE